MSFQVSKSAVLELMWLITDYVTIIWMSFLVFSKRMALGLMLQTPSGTFIDTMLIGSKTLIWVMILDWATENILLPIGQCKCQSTESNVIRFLGRWAAIDIFNLPGWDASAESMENSQAEESCCPSAQCHCTHEHSEAGQIEMAWTYNHLKAICYVWCSALTSLISFSFSPGGVYMQKLCKIDITFNILEMLIIFILHSKVDKMF